VPGTVPYDDRFELLDPDGQPHRVGRPIPDFHAAVSDFAPPRHARWQALIPSEGDEIIATWHRGTWSSGTGGPSSTGMWPDTSTDGKPRSEPEFLGPVRSC
jgi:hypothetical protein